MTPASQQADSSVATILHVLRRRVRTVAASILILTGLAVVLSLTQQKEYTAAASLLFRDPQLDQKLFGSTFLAPSTDPEREGATNVELVSLPVVAERTERRLPGVGKVQDKVAIKPEGQSDVVSLEATDETPRIAAQIANTFANEYIAFRRDADRAKTREAQGLVRRQIERLDPPDRAGSQGRSLRQRADQLQILASLQTGNAERAERAEIPSSPSSPKVARNIGLGLLLGLVLGVALALMRERLDRRIRDPKEMEAVFERPILGAIPETRALSKSQSGTDLSTQEAESFRMLRANLRYFNIDRDIKSVLITSAAPGDGKTTVTWNLASAAGAAGSKVLLIEADLRHPRLGAALGLHPTHGLSTVLAGDAQLNDAVQQIAVSGSQRTGSPRTIDVLLSGPLPPNPTDLIESERMHALIETAEAKYDLVVIDTPPTSVVPDAIPIVRRVGGVIVVGRLGKSTRVSVAHLRDQLRNLDAPTLGVVVNGLGSDAEGYGYGYGYGYGAAESRSSDESVDMDRRVSV